MVRATTAALAAAALACASSANAAFFTYTFNLSGSGQRTTQDVMGNVRYDDLASAQIIMGVQQSGASDAFGNDFLTSFRVLADENAVSFDFQPDGFQAIFRATGSGSACYITAQPSGLPGASVPVSGCSAGYEFAGRGGVETFGGYVSSFSVTTQASGRPFFDIVSYVPEPSAWALMLAGFGMVSYALRRRPKLSYAR